MLSNELIKEMENFQKSLHPDKYIFDAELVDDLEYVFHHSNELYKKNKSNKYLQSLNKVSNKFYDQLLKNEINYERNYDDSKLDKLLEDYIEDLSKKIKISNNNKSLNIKKTDFTKKDKIRYYSSRVNNKKLTAGQRAYAQKRINELR